MSKWREKAEELGDHLNAIIDEEFDWCEGQHVDTDDLQCCVRRGFIVSIQTALQAVRAEAFEEAAEIVYYSDARKEERRVPLSELYEQLRAKAKGYSGGEIRIGWEGKLGND